MIPKRLREIVGNHVSAFWTEHQIVRKTWNGRPPSAAMEALEIYVVSPLEAEQPTIYVTAGVSEVRREGMRHEFLIMAPVEDELHDVHLAMLARYHADRTIYPVHLGRIVHIGEPWVSGSKCDHFLASLPYAQGPEFEVCSADDESVRFLWLTPITSPEAAYVSEHGQEALEQLLESRNVRITDPFRDSVVCDGTHPNLHVSTPSLTGDNRFTPEPTRPCLSTPSTSDFPFKMATWRFDVRPNTAVVTSTCVMKGGRPILYVTHDFDHDDGPIWQFHCGNGDFSQETLMLVGLAEVLALDPSLYSLAEMPLAHVAQRAAPTAPWTITRESTSDGE